MEGLFVEFGGDASGLLSALNDASNGVASFGQIAEGVFAGLGASDVFSAFTTGIANLASYIVGTTSDFQQYGQTFTNTLANMSQASDSTTSVVSAGAAKQAADTLKAQDALIRYNEKIQSIQDNIDTVMQGQNVIDAQSQMYDQLNQMAQTYADKVQSINDQIDQSNQDLATREANRKQNMDNTLQDMQLSHQDQVANTTEEYQQKMAQTQSTVAKAALQKELDDKLKLMNDSYNREYTTKQTELKRNMDQQNAADEQATAQKIAKFKSEIDKENTLYDEQVAKYKKDEDKKIETLKESNAKKLAMYKQELADENRAYKLQQAEQAVTAAGGGKGGGNRMWSFGLLSEMQKGQDFFLNMNETASELQGHIQQFASQSPFNLHDIEQADQGLAALGLNVEKMNPVLADLAGHWHTSFSTAAQALQDLIAGNGRMLAYNFHITTDELRAALGGKTPTSVNQLMQAFQNLDESAKLRGSFKGGRLAAFDTLPGQMSNIQDQMAKFALSFMGIDTSAKHFGTVIKGGLFDELYHALKNVGNYLSTHQDQIAGFFKALGAAIAGFFNVAGGIIHAFAQFYDATKKVIDFFKAHGTATTAIIAGLATAIGTYLFLALVSVASTAIPAAIAAIIGLGAAIMTSVIPAIAVLLVTAAPFIVLGVGVAAAVFLVIEAFKHWSDITKFFSDAWKKLTAWLGNALKDITDWGKNIAKAFINGITHGLQNVGSAFGSAFSKIGAFLEGHSPTKEGPLSQIDKWGFNVGMAWLGGLQNALGNMSLPQPNTSAISATGGSGQNYNTNQNFNTRNIVMNNAFSIHGQGNAENVAEYLGFMLEHRGIV